MTGLAPAERFANHKAGIKSSAAVKRYGLRLLPELYQHLNPMPYEAAARMEVDLAEDLRRAGYTVACFGTCLDHPRKLGHNRYRSNAL